VIKIGYGGTLGYYNPENKKKNNFIFRLIRTYRHQYELSISRSPYYFFKALSKLKENDIDLKSKIQVFFWGSIDENNLDLVNNLNISDIVSIEGMLTKKASIDKLKNCDILYLPMEKQALKHKTLFIPGKVFEYILLKKPILMLDKDSDCREIVEKTGLGIFADNENVDEIAEVLIKIIDKSSFSFRERKINNNYIDSLSFEYRAKEMAVVFDNLIRN
jgi:glycosyltransferase involved in cell wall biosynthesis